MKVIQLLSRIQVDSDGVSVCGRNLSLALIDKVDLEVHVYKVKGDVPKDLNVKLYEIQKLPRILSPLNSLCFSPQMKRGLRESINNVDILHIHSLWMMPQYYAYQAIKGKNTKICVHIHGTLSPWSLNRSKLKKQISLILFKQKALLKRADLLIASTQDEYKQIRDFGLSNPVAIIPNGLEIPALPSIKKRKQVLFLARIHKVKGLDILIDVWKDIITDNRLNEWELLIAGPTNSEYAQQMISRSKGIERISFVGEKFGREKTAMMSEAMLYVLPTHTENFGISIAEALACGTPVITTTGAPWSGLETNNCGKWIELSHDSLKSSMTDMMLKSETDLIQMGINGRNWVEQNFSWREIADKTKLSYEWLINPNSIKKPDWILLN